MHCLHHLCLSLRKLETLNESSILAKLNIDQLYTFIIRCKTSDEMNKNLPQWIINHTYLTANDSFVVKTINEYFILWKWCNYKNNSTDDSFSCDFMFSYRKVKTLYLYGFVIC